MSTTANRNRETPSVNSYLLRSTGGAALGGLLFGFDTAVIAGTTGALRQVFSLSPAMLGFTVSAALWGTVLGSLLAGPPSDRYGRRVCLTALAALYLASALGCALAWSWPALLAFRAIGGLAIGASSVVGPMYIAEISPAAKRGRLVGLFQTNVVAGILLAYLFLVVTGGFGAAKWRWEFAMARHSFGHVSRCVVRHSGKPSLAGLRQPDRGSRRSFAARRGTEYRPRVAGDRQQLASTARSRR